ncbi:MAG TPA: glucose-1-phosphate cytidylyltransferase [Clostridiales bacterium]|nr:glucose-1-phosphate cytidylyltransferase [Clostridiales bacterium]
MKVVILAGGFGTRINEESHLRPKAMVEIGERPILWHIMKIYSRYGFQDFIICLGYKGYCIKEYFQNYFLHASDVTFDFNGEERRIVHTHKAEPWRVTLVDTGLGTMTGGRLERVRPYLGEETFMMTYADGVSDVNLAQLLEYHYRQGSVATVTSVQPAVRFGVLRFGDNGKVEGFSEKPEGEGAWINAGFFVLEPEIFSCLNGDATVFEKEPLEKLARTGRLSAYRHAGFWQPMDTLRDKNGLEALWQSGKAPWKIWD